MKQEIKERVERIRNGEVPEGYVINKFGIYPEDWVKMPFYQIFDFEGGFTASRNDLGDEGIAYLHYGDIHKSNKNFIDVKKELFGIPKINLNINNVPKKNLLKDGYVVFADASEDYEGIGKSVTIFNPDEIPFINGLHTIVGVPKNGTLNKNYSRFFLLEQSIRKQRMFYAQGISVLGISKVYLKKIIVQLPSDPEQQKLAKILSTWDKAIELKEKLIDEKKKFRIAIVADLLFGLKRFDEFIKSHKYNSTKYTNIPEDWEFIKIGEIATEVSEKNGNNDELPVLSCTKHSGLVDSLTYFKKRVFSKDTSTYKQVKKNQFVYATNHIDEGSIGCQNIYDNSLVSPMYTVFKTNSKVNNDFLFSLLKTRLYIFIYQVNMSASVDRRGSLRWNEFSKIRIPLPDIAEQNKIVEFIRSVDNEIELLKLELNQSKEQKRGLMQLLLTGIIRVEVD
jgi:type I restriction enzyme S subunit